MRPESVMVAESRKGSLARIKDLVVTSKPMVEVRITDEQTNEPVPQYTSLDEIKGEASITASCDTTFEHIYASFEGSCRTYVDKIATASPTNSRSEAIHSFVRLIQPMDLSAFSEPRVLEAGKTYNFPFIFVVPDTILPQACDHPKQPNFPAGGHMTPPPTLGDRLATSMDDMAPHMGVISYSIKCRITNGRGSDGKYKATAEGSKRLRIIPAIEEQPPLDVTMEGDDRYDYKMKREKSIRRGFLKGKLGRISVQSRQPHSLKLPYWRESNAESNPTTMATVDVRFDGVKESTTPPGLSSLQAKLKVATCFTSVPMDEIPLKSSDYHSSNVRGIYVETVNLSTLNLSNIRWQKHDRSPGLPEYLNPEVVSPPAGLIGRTFHTAVVAVPITLPKGNKILVPSFHSCLVSRIYALDLYLSIDTTSATLTNPKIHLKLPLQVSSEGNPQAMAHTCGHDHAALETESNAHLDPRSEANPAPEYTQRATERDRPDSPVSHRAAGTTHHDCPQCRARLAQRRFRSVSFEEEEEVAAPPPPAYSQIGSRRQAVRSNVPESESGRN